MQRLFQRWREHGDVHDHDRQQLFHPIPDNDIDIGWWNAR